MKRIFVYYLIEVILLSIAFFMYMPSSFVAPAMDFCGYAYFTAACVMHSSVIMLIPLLLCLLLTRFKLCRTAAALFIALASVLQLFAILDNLVYQLYRFHINGFVFNMVFSSAGLQIFDFDVMLYVKAIVVVLSVFIANFFVLKLSKRLAENITTKRISLIAIPSLLLIALFANTLNAYGAFAYKPSIVKSARMLPYYFPLTANSLMTRLGFTPPTNGATGVEMTLMNGDVSYPINSISREKISDYPNIVFIWIDSWNKRALTNDCMPNIYDFAGENVRFDNHFACSNGTRTSIFSTFYSVPSLYWDDFSTAKISPVFIDELINDGYDIRLYPSASLEEPPFIQTVFQKVKNPRVQAQGSTSFERDKSLTEDFLKESPVLFNQDKPFFAFLFYDLAHSIKLPEGTEKKFTPAWDYADYASLDNDTDPTQFFNLYKNCCYQIDIMVGQVIKALKSSGKYDNTIIVISGDHSQEFNENHKNFWGHNGNFSKAQIGVPFICHFPREQHQVYTHRTTHYDLVPTIMHDYLGVKNDIRDYSAGCLLQSNESRYWQVVGSDLNYAFIVPGDTILEKMPDGSLQVTDANLNEINDYQIDPTAFNKAVAEMNRFYKK